MAPISEDTWAKILNNQKLPLIGTNEPENGNGYHDGISWRFGFRPQKQYDDELFSSTFYTIYLRDLGLFINPNLSKKQKFESGLKIIGCSDNYYNTFIKYFTNEKYYRHEDLLNQLGNWGEDLSYHGRLIFEIIGWYDNKSSQLYGYNLNRLDIDYCEIKKTHIVYNAPFELQANKEIFKKVKIPKNKCIIIEFPNELGGYDGFEKKVKAIKKLGSKFTYSHNPGSSLGHWKNWDKQFNKIVSDWGASSKIEDVTEFYYELSALRFTYMVILCTHELINGLQQLISFLNRNLTENASVEFTIVQYDIEHFRGLLKKWLQGELSFKEANELLRI